MKCNILRLGECYPEESRDWDGNLIPGCRPPVIVFEKDRNEYPPDYWYFSNAIFTGCGADNTSETSATDFVYFLYGIIKVYQTVNGADHTFISPAPDIWEDEECYDSEKLRRLGEWDSGERFWNLNNLTLDLSRYWQYTSFPSIKIWTRTYDSFPGLAWQNDDAYGNYMNCHWTGYGSTYSNYIHNINNYNDDNGNSMNSNFFSHHCKLIFPFIGSANKLLRWELAGWFDDNGQFHLSNVCLNFPEHNGLEVHDSYSFVKETLRKPNGEPVKAGTVNFLGPWIVGGDNVTNTVSFEKIQLLGNTDILVGRKTGYDGALQSTLKSYQNTAMVLDSELVGGNYMPVLRKCDNGALLVTCNSPAYTGTVAVCEGTFALKENVHFSCWDFQITPNSKDRNSDPRSELLARPVHLLVSASKGSVLEAKSFDGFYERERYTHGSTHSVVDVPFGSCTLAFTNATLRLSGNSGVVRIEPRTAKDATMLEGKVHLDIGSGVTDSTPAMTVEIPNSNANYTFDIPTTGSGTLRKQGPGTLHFLSTPSQAVSVECTEGIVDFKNAYIHNRLGGTGTLRNCQYDLVIQDPVADPFSSLILGEGCVAKSLTIDFRNRDWSDCIIKKFPIATCATSAHLQNLRNQLKEIGASNYSLLFESTFPFKAPELQLFVDESNCKLFGRIIARGAGSLLLIN